MCKEKGCKICYEKTFASHEKSQFWSKKNKEYAGDVFKISGKSYWFTCNTCNHEFNTVIASITTKNTWCPYCSIPPKIMCYDCDICFNISLSFMVTAIPYIQKVVLLELVTKSVLIFIGIPLFYNLYPTPHSFCIQLLFWPKRPLCPQT